MSIQNVTLETIGIERSVDNKDEQPTTWRIYFLSDGYVEKFIHNHVTSFIIMSLITLTSTISFFFQFSI